MTTSFKELIVWQKAMILTEQVYHLAKSLPPEELYSLSSQIKRSALSIPSNIAEGNKRGSRAEYRRFLLVALGSAGELETQLLLVERLYHIDISTPLATVEEIEKMLSVITKKLSTP